MPLRARTRETFYSSLTTVSSSRNVTGHMEMEVLYFLFYLAIHNVHCSQCFNLPSGRRQTRRISLYPSGTFFDLGVVAETGEAERYNNGIR